GRGELPATSRLLRRVGRRHDGHPGGQVEVARDPVEDHPEECRLDGRRSRGDLVQEEDAPSRLSETDGPGRWCQGDPSGLGLTGDDGETGKVARLSDAGDHNLEGQVQVPGHGLNGGRLAYPG